MSLNLTQLNGYQLAITKFDCVALEVENRTTCPFEYLTEDAMFRDLMSANSDRSVNYLATILTEYAEANLI
jgi:glutamate synthase domain-containing protein 2